MAAGAAAVEDDGDDRSKKNRQAHAEEAKIATNRPSQQDSEIIQFLVVNFLDLDEPWSATAIARDISTESPDP